MKTKLVWVLAIVAIAFTACNEDQFGLDKLNKELKSVSINDVEPEFTSDSTSLTDAEAAGILLMREEEKMAHDVYTYFFNQYDHRVFNQIASSEAKHTETIGELISYFGLEDPILDGEGNFTSTEIQDLYNDLIAAGSESLTAALSTGALIEEVDIIDLVELMEATNNSDLQTVYGNLLSGSENHLRAFVANLSAQGVEYTPQLLSIDYFTAILADNSEKGNGNKGTGNNDSEACDSTGVQNGNNQGQGNNGQQGNGNNSGNGQGEGNEKGNNQGNNGNQGNGNNNHGTQGNQGNGNGQGEGVDADGDGLCDETGEPIGSGSEGENKGEGNGEYVDADGNGICDITGETIGEGEGNSNSQSGTNSGNGNGNNNYGNGNGK